MWLGASEWLAAGGSETLFLGGTQWGFAGASAFAYIGASERMGASERLGASESWRAGGGASEWVGASESWRAGEGASPLGGASDQRFSAGERWGGRLKEEGPWRTGIWLSFFTRTCRSCAIRKLPLTWRRSGSSKPLPQRACRCSLRS